MDNIAWFADITLGDVEHVGGKGANLGELTRAGLPVPPGFVITAEAYLDAMDHGGVRHDLVEIETETNPDDARALETACARMQELIAKAGVGAALRQEIERAYSTLDADRVAVRSSATAEDTAGTSFAGMNRTFTDVAGVDAVVDRVVDCWASLFSPRVVVYRRARDVRAEPAIAVVVQQMVESERSGVMFTADPVTGARERLVIEAAFGLGEVVVSGQVEPDTYVVAKDGPRLIDVRIGRQTHKIVRTAQGDKRVDLDDAQASARVCDDAEILALAALGLRVESHYGEPQDVEWAIAKRRTYLVQSRPITTGGTAATVPDQTGGTVLLSGLGASPGTARGKVRVLASPAEGDALQTGEVLVAAMTNPDWVPLLRRASALVTDGGGMTCHAAIVSRELGVPCVVGTRDATRVLTDGMPVTVDGARGTVTAGTVAALPATPRVKSHRQSRPRSSRPQRGCTSISRSPIRRSALRPCRSTGWASCVPSS